MSKAIFQIMGGFALGFAALLFFGGVLTIAHYPPRSLLDIVPLAALILTLVSAGVGLLYLRKWAALAICALTLYAAAWAVKDALHPIPGYANWVVFLFGFLLIIPSILTATYWRTLVWRRKIGTPESSG